MDSYTSSPVFQIHREKADSFYTALTRTLLQINH